MIMKRNSYFFSTAAFVIAGLSAQACAGDSQHAAQTSDPIEVRTATLAVADISDTFEAGGIVQARTTATIAARILAPVREVRVKPGDAVRAGQVLVLLDGRDLGAQARSARAAAMAADQGAAAAVADQQAADASLALARAAHSRIAGLHARRSATSQEFDEATAALRRAEAQAASAAARVRGAGSGLDSARAAADAAATAASFATITAPFAGIVTEKFVEPGNMTAPGSPLVRLEDTRGFRLDVHVDESRAGALTVGSPTKVLLETGAGAATVDARISEISRAIDTDARAFLVKLELPDIPGVRSGQFGRALFHGSVRRALMLPETAIVRRGQVTSVMVVDKDVARLRLVNVSGTEVLAGLQAGDVVILNPPAELTDGRRVSVGGRS